MGAAGQGEGRRLVNIAGIALVAALYAVGAFSLVLIIRDALNGRGSEPGIELHEEDW